MLVTGGIFPLTRVTCTTPTRGQKQHLHVSYEPSGAPKATRRSFRKLRFIIFPEGALPHIVDSVLHMIDFSPP